VNEILEHVNLAMQLRREEIRETAHDDLFPPNQAPNQLDKGNIKKKEYLYMYTNDGKRVKNVLDIPDSTLYLIASEKKKFKDIKHVEPRIDTNYTNHYTLKQKILNFKDRTAAPADESSIIHDVSIMSSIFAAAGKPTTRPISKTERKPIKQAKFIPGTDRPVKVKAGPSHLKYPRLRPLHLAPIKPGMT
jgi:hypothetical protein